MTAVAVADVLAALDTAGVYVVVDGGWAIDALIGRQCRPHQDLDLIAFEASLDGLRATVDALGFERFSRSARGRAEIAAGDGRIIDLHLLDGDGVQHGPAGERWPHPPAMLEGLGSIAGRAVRCLTAEAQVHTHLDREHNARDKADLIALRAATGVGLPLPFTDGVDVVYRDATELDAMAIAEVSTRSASIAYQGIFPSHLPPPDRVQRWSAIREGLAVPRTWTGLLTVGGAVGGVVHLRPWPAGHDSTGLRARTALISSFFVHPALWGRRWGETLFRQAVARAVADYDDVRLWVLASNTRAQRYYERLGWERDGAVKDAAPGVTEERWRLKYGIGRG